MPGRGARRRRSAPRFDETERRRSMWHDPAMNGRGILGMAFLVNSPFLRRILWHGRRIASQVDRRFFLALLEGAGFFVLAAALLVTLREKDWTASLGEAVA